MYTFDAQHNTLGGTMTRLEMNHLTEEMHGVCEIVHSPRPSAKYRAHGIAVDDHSHTGEINITPATQSTMWSVQKDDFNCDKTVSLDVRPH